MAVSREQRRLYQQVQLAASRALAFLALLGIHKLVSLVIPFVLPRTWTAVKDFLEGTLAVGFGLIYVAQTLEMLAVFIPRLVPLRDRLLGSNNDKEEQG